MGVALNFGAGGLLLWTEHPLDAGEVITVEQIIIGREAYHLGVRARVAWALRQRAHRGTWV